MIVRNVSGIDPDAHHHGFSTAREEFFEPFSKRSEAAVVSDHEKRGRACFLRRLIDAADFLHLLAVYRQRLLDPSLFVDGNGGHDRLRMAVLT